MRRKGMVIVDSDRGILVVAGMKKRFTLPGGGAEGFESRKKAAIRELYEETNLRVRKIKYLFRHLGDVHFKRGRKVQNNSKVFLVIAEGNLIPKNEIKYINFWKPGTKLNITDTTKRAIEKYLTEYKI